MILLESATGLRLTVLDRLEALEELRPEWEDLLARSASAEPMLAPDWLLTWWRTYGERRRLAVGTFYENDRLVGLAPLYSRRFTHRFSIPFRRLEPLGADVDEQDGVCSEYLNLICEEGSETSVAEAFVTGLVTGKFGRWDEFVLPAMDGDGVMPEMLMQVFQAKGIAAEKVQTTEAAYIPLPGTWDEYLKTLPQRKRYVVNRSLRDFEAWAGADAVFTTAHTPAELEEGKRILKHLHGERWSVDGKLGCFHAPRFAAFHDEYMAKALEQSQLELVWLTVRGEPVAAVYNIVANGKVYFYQSGRSVDVPKEQRIGIVILAHCIRGAIERGLREFDLLGGMSQYKTTLAPCQRPLVQVRAARSCSVEALRRLVEGGVTLARNVKRRLFPKLNEQCKA